MNPPEISVITAVYNSEKYLEENINSILNQGFKNFEQIIIDDNSTDKSKEIMKKYAKKDKRIKIIHSKKHLGAAGTRNLGLKKAKGKYIAILDSDDVALPNRLREEYNYLEKNPHIFLIGSSAIYINEKGREIRKFRKYNNYKMIAWRLPKSCGIIHSSTMFRNYHSIFYNEEFRYAHDYELYLNILSKKKNLTNLPNFLIKYRVSKNAVSNRKKKEQKYFRDKIQRKYKFLNKKLSFSKRLKYNLRLVLFYLKTFLEKSTK